MGRCAPSAGKEVEDAPNSDGFAELKGMPSASDCCSLACSASSVVLAVGCDGPLTVVPTAMALRARRLSFEDARGGALTRLFLVGMTKTPKLMRLRYANRLPAAHRAETIACPTCE